MSKKVSAESYFKQTGKLPKYFGSLPFKSKICAIGLGVYPPPLGPLAIPPSPLAPPAPPSKLPYCLAFSLSALLSSNKTLASPSALATHLALSSGAPNTTDGGSFELDHLPQIEILTDGGKRLVSTQVGGQVKKK